jgi:hypothetical protein
MVIGAARSLAAWCDRSPQHGVDGAGVADDVDAGAHAVAIDVSAAMPPSSPVIAGQIAGPDRALQQSVDAVGGCRAGVQRAPPALGVVTE